MFQGIKHRLKICFVRESSRPNKYVTVFMSVDTVELLACTNHNTFLSVTIPLHQRLLLESNVLLAAKTKHESKIEIPCTDNLTVRAIFKIAEYCYNVNIESTSSFPLTNCSIFALGIFGTTYLQECLLAATVLDLKILKEALRSTINAECFPIEK